MVGSLSADIVFFERRQPPLQFVHSDFSALLLEQHVHHGRYYDGGGISMVAPFKWISVQRDERTATDKAAAIHKIRPFSYAAGPCKINRAFSIGSRLL